MLLHKTHFGSLLFYCCCFSWYVLRSVPLSGTHKKGEKTRLRRKAQIQIHQKGFCCLRGVFAAPSIPKIPEIARVEDENFVRLHRCDRRNCSAESIRAFNIYLVLHESWNEWNPSKQLRGISTKRRWILVIDVIKVPFCSFHQRVRVSLVVPPRCFFFVFFYATLLNDRWAMSEGYYCSGRDSQ